MRQFGTFVGVGLTVLLWLVAPVAGAEHGGSAPPAAGHGEKPGEAGKPVSDDLAVDIPVVTAPLVNARDRLVDYAFVGIRIRARNAEGVDKIKADLPLVQDAIVRAINSHPLADADDDAALEASLLARITSAVSEAFPPGLVQEVILKDIVRSSA